ncbi:MAG: hypothetical protein JNM94_17075 [Phycisphaerae bacterium]|nr:hypothetical protein [Phycisphaerae bacterium]
MSKITLCAAGLAAIVGSVAAADTNISLGNNSLVGGASNTYTFNLSGSLTDFSIAFDYVDGNSASWASDMILQIIDPNGVNKYWGGTNVVPAGSTFQAFWSFDGSGSTNSGPYSDTSNAVAGMSGNGTWTFRIWNGWTGATNPCQYNNVAVSLKGSIVPAPGALALLGLAGLAGRRRRA